MQATVLQAVSATLGRPVGLEEPLMTAGLDSLGTYLLSWATFNPSCWPEAGGATFCGLVFAARTTALLAIGQTCSGDGAAPWLQVLCLIDTGCELSS